MIEEEHSRFHRQGEMIKFLLLAIIMLGSVLLIAAVSPLIFDQILPGVLGLEPAGKEPTAAPAEGEDEVGPEVDVEEAPLLTPPEMDEAEAPAEIPAEDPGGSRSDQSVAPGTPPGGVTATPPSPTPTSSPAETAAPTATPQIYTIQQGDTLTEIAERFGVTVEAIVAANSLSDPNRIFPGDMLRIPAR